MGEMGGYAWRMRRKWRTATTILGYFLAVIATVGLVAAMSSDRRRTAFWAAREHTVRPASPRMRAPGSPAAGLHRSRRKSHRLGGQ